ncbi:insulinase family protein [Neptuniibacter halophilus]|uniref:insulinase family protein n=1 Tax=Neptuniibacter halophilus TaxID=651666 RepID=UPI002573062D|nr:insulinase family protein [Neptuniibacter halophilus]
MYSLSIHRSFLSLLTLLILFTLSLNNVQADVEKSPNDPKHYRSLTLDNQLRVLLISKPGADKAAASMNVAVGSSANPEERAGLAHFLEHMLFLGTEKYPEADEYQSFIRSHGGGHNAYTAQENTNYFFDVSAEHLEPALDRFAQFFIAPLFDAKYVDRERHAVHSEYQAKIKDDYRRGFAVSKSLMNPENSQNRFVVGSLKTLADREGSPIRDELIDFYQQYYSANLMTLVVLGGESLDQLEQMVRQKFSAVKNHNATEFQDTAPLFIPGQLPQQVKIKSVKDIRSLTLTFPIAETRSHWRAKPVYYISHLLGYEGHGSLLSLLKEKGWATALSASQGHNLSNGGSIMINIQLTEAGEKNYLSVTQTVFQFAELIRRQGVQEQLYREQQQLSQISFRFQEQAEPIHLVSGLAQQMQHYPTELALSADYKFEQFDPQLIQSYLQQIRPDNLFLSLKSQAVEGDQTEPYYNVPYQTGKLTAAQLKQLEVTAIDPALSVPGSNPFIAENLELQQGPEQAVPQLISHRPGFEHWYQSDTRFGLPKANAYFTLQSAEANRNARNWVLNSLYTSMLQEQLNETLYDAYLAGLSTQIYPHMKGITLRLSGYNDKLDRLMQAVIPALTTLELNEKRFRILKQQYLDSLNNELNEKPSTQTSARLYELLLPQWSNQAQQAALQEVTLQDLADYSQRLLRAPTLKLLSHGNLNRAQADVLERTLTSSLLQEQAEAPEAIRVTRIPLDQPLNAELDINHDDSALAMLLQGESNALRSQAQVALLSEILAAPFYHQVRTEKQLGYIVFATPIQMNKTPGIGFIIQSPVATATDLKNEVDGFLAQWGEKLKALDQDSLARYKNSVVARISQQENTLSSRSKRYWRELDWGETGFDSRQKLAAEVEKLTLADLEQTLSQLQRRKLTVSSNGKRFSQKDSKENIAQISSELKQLRSSGAIVPEA